MTKYTHIMSRCTLIRTWIRTQPRGCLLARAKSITNLCTHRITDVHAHGWYVRTFDLFLSSRDHFQNIPALPPTTACTWSHIRAHSRHLHVHINLLMHGLSKRPPISCVWATNFTSPTTSHNVTMLVQSGSLLHSKDKIGREELSVRREDCFTLESWTL